MKKGGGSESTIIVDTYKSVLVYALHSLEYIRPRPCPISVVRAKIIYYYIQSYIMCKVTVAY